MKTRSAHHPWKLGLAILSMLLCTQPLLATEYFVSPTTGNDGNPGTSEAAPLKTWAAGDAKLVAGDTLTLLDGTYPIGAVTKSGTPDAWITLRAKNPRQAIISLAAGWHNGGSKCVDLSHVAYVKVIGLTVIGCAATDHTIVDAQHGINMNGSHHILVQGCRVKDCSGGGIGAYDKYWDATGQHNGPCDFITVEGNEISGCAFWCKYLSSGISMCDAKDAGLGKDPSGYNIIVRNNLCYGNENKIGEFTKDIKDVATATDGNGIIIDYLTPNNHYPHNVLVEGNLCFDNGGRGIHVFHSGNTTVRYNTCWHNNRNKLYGSWKCGELEGDWAENYQAQNNIAVAGDNPWSAALALHATASAMVLKRNLLSGSREVDAKVQLIEAGTLTADPRLVNPLADPILANFHLQAGSPAIHAADDTPAPATDPDGVRRPHGGANDIGAYAYVAAPAK